MGSKIKAIDLFSGCGGVSIGLTNAGFEVTCAVEIDDAAVKACWRDVRHAKNFHCRIVFVTATRIKSMMSRNF